MHACVCVCVLVCSFFGSLVWHEIVMGTLIHTQPHTNTLSGSGMCVPRIRTECMFYVVALVGSYRVLTYLDVGCRLARILVMIAFTMHKYIHTSMNW